ncbi:hypothetical protein HGRIS_005847 [Hohenbuehelia grisea]|uniref:Sensitive to high expression protein 9, mitochondrial n=1 Tax=Hohenbuehelia grisea TaxID=104357 RepID=A0ABR3JY13_9AGAR
MLAPRTFVSRPALFPSTLHRYPLINYNAFSTPASSTDPTPEPLPRDVNKDPPTASAEPPTTTRVHQLQEVLQRWTTVITSSLRAHADRYSSSAKTTFSQLGSQLNKATGYDEIEVLKRKVVDQEARLHTTRQTAREIKFAYDQAVLQRSKSQREVNDLLQRKSTWTDGDVSRFTNLVRQDHLIEQEEARTKVQAQESEDLVEREFSELMRSILARYHEEQVWSDKIRSASTYGSLTALGLNMFVFIMAILVVEPWKRRRLAQTFELKVEELSKDTAELVDARIGKLETIFNEQTALLATSIVGPRNEAAPSGAANPSVSADSDAQSQAPLPPDIARLLEDREVQKVVAASAVMAGVVGWLFRAWFDR